MVIVDWRYSEDGCEVLLSVNVVIAAYTTAQARLKLYDHLDALGLQALYYDTDNVLYVHKDGLYSIRGLI